MSYVSEFSKFVGNITFQHPEIVVIVHRNGIEFLMQLRSDNNKYGLLCGGVQNEEEPKDCVVRELKEKACILTNIHYLNLCNVYDGRQHRTIHANNNIVFVYKLEYSYCTKLDRQYYNEAKKLNWFTKDEMEHLMYGGMIFPNNIPIIRDILNGKI